MRELHGFDVARQATFRDPVVTLGVFDGVHRGHLKVIDAVVSLARSRSAEAVVVTFSNHPDGLLQGRAPQLITSLRHRLRIFEDRGMDCVVVLPFDERLRDMTAEDFVQQLFLEGMKAKAVVLGHGSRFGNKGRGTVQTFCELGGSDLTVRAEGPVIHEGKPVSSTRVRHAIRSGELDDAFAMLGRPIGLLGTVVSGDGRGRKIGIPTANLDLHQEVHPPRGVYGVNVSLANGQTHRGLMNIGVRPTFASGSSDDPQMVLFVEVHILDFVGDLYGQDIEVQILMRLRSEKKFDGVEELIAQIHRDREMFLAALGGQKAPDQKNLTSGARNL